MTACRDHSGKWSMMRIGFFVTLITGVAMCLCAIPAVFMSLPDANALILGGSGMISATGFAKAVQTKWESVNANP